MQENVMIIFQTLRQMLLRGIRIKFTISRIWVFRFCSIDCLHLFLLEISKTTQKYASTITWNYIYLEYPFLNSRKLISVLDNHHNSNLCNKSGKYRFMSKKTVIGRVAYTIFSANVQNNKLIRHRVEDSIVPHFCAK